MPDRHVKERQKMNFKMLVTKVQHPKSKKQEIKRQAKGKSEAKTKPKDKSENYREQIRKLQGAATGPKQRNQHRVTDLNTHVLMT